MRRIAIVVAGLGLSLGAQAANLQDFTSLFTPSNIARFLPGYSAAQYANMAKLIQVDFAGNANCVASFDAFQSANPLSGKTAADACGNMMDAQITAYGLSGINWDPLEQLLGLYGVQQYAATVSPQVMTSVTTRYIDNISSALHSIGNQRRAGGPKRFELGGGKTGLAGGEQSSRINGWMSVGANESRNTFGLSSHVGVIGNVMGGIDYAVNKDLTAGLSGGYDYSYIKTVFSKSVMKGGGFTLAPYVSYQIDPRFSIDGVAGYSLGRTDVDVKAGNATTSGMQKFDRQFLAANLNINQWFGEWQASGKLGYTYATETIYGVQSLATDEVKNTIGQARLSAQVGYWMESWMPYAGIAYTYDDRRSYEQLIPKEMRDKDSYTLTLGADVFSKSGWNGGIVYASEIDRKYMRNNSLTANLNYRF